MVKNTPVSADEAALVALNEEFQSAVMTADAVALDRILADDFVLYPSGGGDKPFTKADVIDDARRSRFERNESSDVQARVWGDTGIVTARLAMKGTTDGKPFDATVRFTDTYIRTESGWKQVSAHASRTQTNT